VNGTYVKQFNQTFTPGISKTLVPVSCNAGDYATGGGFVRSSTDLTIWGSYPGSSSHWYFSVSNPGAASADATVYVVCLDIG
jgi:hypothetical protein